MYTVRNIQLTLILLFVLLCTGCEKDNFTDPNDTKFDSEIQSITLNLDQTYQTIDHFGASGGFQDQWIGKWPEATKEPIAKLLFSTSMDDQGNPEGIGLSLWRTIIGDGAADQTNSGFRANSWFRETECYLNPDGNFNFNKQMGEQWFLSKAKEYGVNKFSAWATTPPYFMTKNGYTFSTSEVPTFNCNPEAYDDYANFLADVLDYYETQGYNFLTVCAFNETQYEWNAEVGEASQSGTRATNSEVAAVTRIMNDVFRAKDLNAKIMIPEAAQLAYLYEGNQNTTNQIYEFFNSDSPNYIGDLEYLSNHVAGHSYFSNNTTEQSLTQRTSLRDALASSEKNLDYWQTEYSLLGAAYQQGMDIATFDEIDYALWLSRIIHTDLVYGDATGWSFWTAFNQSKFGDHPFRFNLILYTPNSNGPSHTDGTYQENKLLWALGNYSRFVRPGMVRFDIKDPEYSEASSAVENFMISGFKDETTNDIVMVIVNNTDLDRSVTFELTTDALQLDEDSLKMYITSQQSDLKKLDVNFNDIVIPSKSIVTLTASTKS